MTVHRTRRRRAPERKTPKLVILAGIFLLAVFTNICFPAFSHALGDRVNSVVNYRGAFAAIGEGLSGEKPFTEALGEAWTTAFSGTRSAEETLNPDDGGSAPAMSVDASPYLPPEPFAPDPETSPEEEGANEASLDFADAAIAAFMQSQDAWSDYPVPAGTSYDMPPLGINGTAPADGEITSHFGYRRHPDDGVVRFHYGLDFAGNTGDDIVAFADGEVAAVGDSATLGVYLVLSHGQNVETMYAHCSEVAVETGQAVQRGQVVAKIGGTGNATAPCLHFELTQNGVYLNPEYYLSWQI